MALRRCLQAFLTAAESRSQQARPSRQQVAWQHWWALPDDRADLIQKAEAAKRTDEKIVLSAYYRPGSKKIVCKKLRKQGLVPAIVFEQKDGHLGGNKELIAVKRVDLERLVWRYGRSFFLSKTLELQIWAGAPGEEGPQPATVETVLPKALHLDSGSDEPLNVTFIRAPPTAWLKVHVPVVFLNEDACPGLRKGGWLNTIYRTVEFRCPGDKIPPFVEVDLSQMEIGQKVLLKDLVTPPEVTLVKSDVSLPVCKIAGRVVEDDSKAEA